MDDREQCAGVHQRLHRQAPGFQPVRAAMLEVFQIVAIVYDSAAIRVVIVNADVDDVGSLGSH